MPNHAYTYIYCYGDKKMEFQKLCDALLNKHKEADLNKIIPMPSILDATVKSTDCTPDYYNSYIYHFKKDVYGSDTMLFNSSFKPKYSKEELERIAQGVVTFRDVPMEVAWENAYKAARLYGHSNWYDWSIANWGTKWNCMNTYVCAAPNYVVSFWTAWDHPIAPLNKMIKEQKLNCVLVLAEESDAAGSILWYENGELVPEFTFYSEEEASDEKEERNFNAVIDGFLDETVCFNKDLVSESYTDEECDYSVYYASEHPEEFPEKFHKLLFILNKLNKI